MTPLNKYQISWSPQAYKDLKEIYNYISNTLKEKNIAKKITSKLLKSILNLSYLPERYPKISNFNDNSKNIRKMLVDNYIIIYEIHNFTRKSIYIKYIS